MTFLGFPKHSDELTQRGIIFFHSQMEFLENKLFKMYRINEQFGIFVNGFEHTHDYVQLWYVVKGGFMHTINGKTYTVEQGDLFVIPPFAVHRIELISDMPFEVIGCEFLPQFINDRFTAIPFKRDFFDFSYLEAFLVDEEDIVPKLSLIGGVDIEIRRILDDMYEEYNGKHPYYDLKLKGSLLTLLSIILREFTKESLSGMDARLEKYRHVVTNAIEYIHEHYHEELRLEQMTKSAAVSRTYFCSLFKEFTGKTFNEYLMHVRIRKATQLLLRMDLSVTDVCYGVGFNDLGYFSRMFKKYIGLTPTYYKKQGNKQTDITRKQQRTVGLR